jgi:predicted ATPase
MYFQNIKIEKWQQFENIDIDFDNRLTILTGANGSGKTSILSILLSTNGRINQKFFSIPIIDEISGNYKFVTRYNNEEDESNVLHIGEISHSDGYTQKLLSTRTSSGQYHIEIDLKERRSERVGYLYIPSHRPVPKHKEVTNIPIDMKSMRQAYSEFHDIISDHYYGREVEPTSFIIKSFLLGWAIHHHGTQTMSANAEPIPQINGFSRILKKILPESLGFEKIEIRNKEIIFICNDGRDEFLLETVSGGIAALIDIAWQIFMASPDENKSFTVIIDEVESHLHPTLQRQILGDLLEAFPSLRFIVSTHSPLVVGSVRDAKIYALRYDENKRVISQNLDFQNKAKTATEVLDEALGVSFTMPIWAEKKLEQIVETYTNKSMTEEEFTMMRSELEEIGLERLVPSAITKILEEKND